MQTVFDTFYSPIYRKIGYSHTKSIVGILPFLAGVH